MTNKYGNIADEPVFDCRKEENLFFQLKIEILFKSIAPKLNMSARSWHTTSSPDHLRIKLNIFQIILFILVPGFVCWNYEKKTESWILQCNRTKILIRRANRLFNNSILKFSHHRSMKIIILGQIGVPTDTERDYFGTGAILMCRVEFFSFPNFCFGVHKLQKIVGKKFLLYGKCGRSCLLTKLSR